MMSRICPCQAQQSLPVPVYKIPWILVFVWVKSATDSIFIPKSERKERGRRL